MLLHMAERPGSRIILLFVFIHRDGFSGKGKIISDINEYAGKHIEITKEKGDNVVR